MPWFDRLLVQLAGFCGALFMRSVGWTIRIVEPDRTILNEFQSRYGRVIFSLWHGQIFLGTYLARHERVVTIISRHRDGEFIYQIARRLGIKAVRGSSTRGGVSALFRLLTSPDFETDNLCVIPDGPRGPRCRVKAGILHLARLTGLPVLPVAIASSPAWQLGSWDRFQVPRPFSRAVILLGRPISIDRAAGSEEMECKRRQIEEEMVELNRRAEARLRTSRWTPGGRRGMEFSFRLGHRYLTRIGERWWSLPLTLILFPLERIFRLSVGLRNHLFRAGWIREERLPVPVISIGNLSVGGTGKTMMSRMLAGILAERGYRVGVLIRGYGGSCGEEVEVIQGRTEGTHAAARLGDEPVHLARKLPGCVVVRGKNRFLSGLTAVVDHGCDVCLLDDGFQYRRLHRDIEIVLVPSERPFGNGRLLPAGPLREPPDALARADLLVMVRRGGEGGEKGEETGGGTGQNEKKGREEGEAEKAGD